MQLDRNKTLEQLDNEDWGEAEGYSLLVKTIHALRKKPLKDFTVGDLRICIGQHFFDEYLIPIAFEVLEKNPLVEGDYYLGDLLRNVLEAPDTYWTEHPEYLKRIISIVKNAISRLKSSKDQDKLTLELIEEFTANKSRILQIKRGKKG